MCIPHLRSRRKHYLRLRLTMLYSLHLQLTTIYSNYLQLMMKYISLYLMVNLHFCLLLLTMMWSLYFPLMKCNIRSLHKKIHSLLQRMTRHNSLVTMKYSPCCPLLKVKYNLLLQLTVKTNVMCCPPSTSNLTLISALCKNTLTPPIGLSAPPSTSPP